MQSDKTITDIRFLFHAQHLTMNAIADSLGIHHDTVKSVLDLAGRPHRSRPVRQTLLSPYQPLIEGLLEKTPKLRSTRIIQILQDRGYTGGISQLRTLVAAIRPKKHRAFLTLTFFPAEQAQVDWASFGSLSVGKSERKLSCFVMTLSYSRATFAMFTFDQTLESFLRCHILAFAYLGGVARTALYDNLKSAVIDRQGSAIAFNPKLLEMAGHYCFLPKAANVRAGWEKGRVERTIRYIRDSFFAGRDFRDIEEANRSLRHWLDNVCNLRAWPQDRQRTVAEAWAEERPKLMPKAILDFPTDYVGRCVPSKICFVRYDCNEYSAPCEYVGRPLTLVASETRVRILDGAKELGSHERSYSKGERIKDPRHFATIHEQKPQAHARGKRAELISIIGEAAEFFEHIIDAGRPTGNQTSMLFHYIEVYGRESVRSAIIAALKRGIYRATHVGKLLAAADKLRSEVPAPEVIVPDHPQVSDSEVQPHGLDLYDELTKKSQSPEPDHV
jgi:transposase